MKQDKLTTLFSVLAIIGVIMFVMGGNTDFVPAGSNGDSVKIIGIVLLVIGVVGTVVKVAVDMYRKKKNGGDDFD